MSVARIQCRVKGLFLARGFVILITYSHLALYRKDLHLLYD